MSAPGSAPKPSILFVDDEQRLLEGIALLLRKEYDVTIASSGDEALRKLGERGNFAVVVSDFRMPRMNGAEFLHEVMQRAPTATRILLTGEAGVDGARDAVNRGQIFRFLTKPCPTDQLKLALDAGIDHHRLMNAERMVMQETLLECISALMEVLAVTNPVAFGRAQRVKRLAADIGRWLNCIHFWQLEAAALMSQIGYFAVSPELAEKIYYGRPLSVDERSRAAAVPGNAQRLLEHIPRLEPVIQILAALDWDDAQLARLGDRMVGLGARILGATLEYDSLETRGMPKPEIAQAMAPREARFGAKVLDALFASVKVQAAAPVAELVAQLTEAAPGARLREEIRTSTGALLVPVGFEVSQRLLERLSQVAPEVLQKKFKLSAPAA